MDIPQQQRMTRLIVISVVSCIPWLETEDWSYRIAKRLPSSWSVFTRVSTLHVRE